MYTAADWHRVVLVLDLVFREDFPVRLWYHGICGICGSGIGCETVSWIVCVCGSWDSRSVYPVLACSSRECAVCACPGPPAPAGVFEPRNCSGSLLSSVQFSIHGPTPRVRCCCGLCLCLCFAAPGRSAKAQASAPPSSALSTISSALHVQRASQKEKRQISIRTEALHIVIRVSFARVPHDTALSRNIQLTCRAEDRKSHMSQLAHHASQNENQERPQAH